jgi:hypothetical protein
LICHDASPDDRMVTDPAELPFQQAA